MTKYLILLIVSIFAGIFISNHQIIENGWVMGVVGGAACFAVGGVCLLYTKEKE